MYRTHTCNDLTTKEIGQQVTLSGWVHRRRDHGGIIFIDLRDRYGLTQIVFDPEFDQAALEVADKVRPEYVLKVTGEVRKRLEGQDNANMATGQVEVYINEIDILNDAKTPPFEIDQDKPVNEELRLKYRYLDLRKDRMKNNIVLRHKVIKEIRDAMDKESFVEIETPILIKGTPEGSREYLVPSRLYPGKFYVLPQSPQQLKQMLMIAGYDRYFQIARCFRDEDQRGDRQPEFTQLDIEMSFVEEKDVMAVNEKLLIDLTKKFMPDKKIQNEPFPVITWQEAMETYGSDKPDIRFEMKIVDVTDIVKNSGFSVFSNAVKEGGVVKALRVEGGGKFTRKEIDDLTELARIHGAKGLAYFLYEEDDSVRSPLTKFMSEEEIKGITEKTGAKAGDCVFFGADQFNTACEALGQVRLACGDKFNLRDPNVFAFLWVHEFPMFERDQATGGLGAMHHPFTRPMDEDIDLLETAPEKARSIAYDVVLNGNEIGGGSMRIHEQKLQQKIFNILKITPEDAEIRFGHMLEAFSYGAPPHGGIAWGLDRLIMIFAGEPNIREVIAFPKDQKAKDLTLGAPSVMPEKDVAEANVQIINAEKEDKRDVFTELKELLDKGGIKYTLLEHKAVKTSEEAAKVRGTDLKQGARALIFSTDKGYVQSVCSAAKEVDEKKVAALIGARNIQLASPKQVKAVTGCEIGCVPPFGNLFGLQVIIDQSLAENDEIAFNAGRHDRSIKMKFKDYSKVIGTDTKDISK